MTDEQDEKSTTAYEQAEADMIARNYRTPPRGDLRPVWQQKLDRVTYFSDEEFDEATVEDFEGVVKAAIESYIERQRHDDMSINLCDFAFDLIYQLGRADMMKEIQMRKASEYMP